MNGGLGSLPNQLGVYHLSIYFIVNYVYVCFCIWVCACVRVCVYKGRYPWRLEDGAGDPILELGLQGRSYKLLKIVVGN